MSLVKVTTKGQVTIPRAIRRKAGLSTGDVLEAKIERGKITFTPQSILDRDITESIEDARAGQAYGPFDTAEEMIRSLRSGGRRKATGKPRRK
jgi:AbrB family looped-hinge helix DNA binding protein